MSLFAEETQEKYSESESSATWPWPWANPEGPGGGMSSSVFKIYGKERENQIDIFCLHSMFKKYHI